MEVHHNLRMWTSRPQFLFTIPEYQVPLVSSSFRHICARNTLRRWCEDSMFYLRFTTYSSPFEKFSSLNFPRYGPFHLWDDLQNFFPFSASFLASGHCYTSPIIYVHYTCPNHHQTNVHFRRRKRKPTLLSPMKRFRFTFTSTNILNHFLNSIMLHSYSYP